MSKINDRTFEHLPIQNLFSIVKNDLKTLDNEGLIDEGTLIKTVQYCNEKLGLSIREIREIAIPIDHFKGVLPIDFEKLYYVAALKCSNTHIHEMRNPFDNNFDSDIVYQAELDKESLGCVDNYRVIVKKETNTTIHQFGEWVSLDVSHNSEKHCHIDSPNRRHKGKYTIEIFEDHIETPFRSGLLYFMYLGMMKDAEGNITFPFHPLITPYYEWSLKEKVIIDAIFNSDGKDLGNLLKLAQQEKSGAYLDAFNFTTERSYGEFVDAQRKKELKWYSQYFRYLQNDVLYPRHLFHENAILRPFN